MGIFRSVPGYGNPSGSWSIWYGDLHRNKSVGNSSDFSRGRAVPLGLMTSVGMSSLTTTKLGTVASVGAATSVGMTQAIGLDYFTGNRTVADGNPSGDWSLGS